MSQASDSSVLISKRFLRRSGKGKIQGILIASTIILLWASTLFSLLSWDVAEFYPLEILIAIFWQTFLYTGLFITAHDAMHGLVCPQNCQINNLIGSLTLWMYGLFSYEKLWQKHWLHHCYPASKLDPDFHNGKDSCFFAWYFHFIKGYWSWRRLGGLLVIFSLVIYVLHISPSNLALFWVIPSILSSLQLFYFGTFLTHQKPKGGYRNPHRAQSNALPILWSFITCYHFGYHQEHHEHPDVPWWKLPQIYTSS